MAELAKALIEDMAAIKSKATRVMPQLKIEFEDDMNTPPGQLLDLSNKNVIDHLEYWQSQHEQLIAAIKHVESRLHQWRTILEAFEGVQKEIEGMKDLDYSIKTEIQ